MGELKYKVGDKVRIKSLDWYNENKNEYGDVPCGYEVFIDSMTGFCGKVVTIENCYEPEGYTVKEDYDEYTFTDEMIESLVERNGKTYPYKIGDRVVLKGSNRCATITDLKYNSWGNLSYYVKIDNDKDISIDYPTDLLLPYDNMVEGLMENKNNHLTETVVDTVRESNDRYRIVTDPRFDIEVDEGEYYAVRRKNEYPKTYEECEKILGLEDSIIEGCLGYEYKILNVFQKLLMCRDAYWKLAGDEMGLGKPWEPDWRKERYIIYRNQDIIIGGYREAGYVEHHIFEFPTKEIRDNFFNAFRDDIEKCKVLL